MSKEKQIEELTNELIRTNGYGTLNAVANHLYNEGYRKQSEIIRCKDCNYFREYSSEYARTTEGADGDCHIRIMNSNNEQYFACQYDDFCSFAKMKGGGE